jgi:hypothetical protein
MCLLCASAVGNNMNSWKPAGPSVQSRNLPKVAVPVEAMLIAFFMLPDPPPEISLRPCSSEPF